MPSRTDDFIMVGSWAQSMNGCTRITYMSIGLGLSNISSLVCCAAVVDGLACSASEISIQVTRRSDSLDLRASFSGKSKSGDFRRTPLWQGEERKKEKGVDFNFRSNRPEREKDSYIEQAEDRESRS